MGGLLLDIVTNTLHWRVLLKAVKVACSQSNGKVLKRTLHEKFIPEKASRSQRKQCVRKIDDLLQMLESKGYIAQSMGQLEQGVGVVVVFLKDGGSVLGDQDETNPEDLSRGIT